LLTCFQGYYKNRIAKALWFNLFGLMPNMQSGKYNETGKASKAGIYQQLGIRIGRRV